MSFKSASRLRLLAFRPPSSSIRLFTTTGAARKQPTSPLPSAKPTATGVESMVSVKQFSAMEQMYIKRINEQNTERVLKERRVRLHYRVVGGFLIVFTLGVYFYTIMSIKQEKFLDDFDAPEPPDPAVKNFKR
jgi:cytochrome c oxidase assembly factor 3